LKILPFVLLGLSTFQTISYSAELIYPTKMIKSFNASSSSLQQLSNSENLNIDATAFKLIDTKESLTGKHFYFQQMMNGLAIDGAQLVVSVNSKNEVIKFFNSSVNQKNQKLKNTQSFFPFISKADALELAWKYLNVNGELTEAPTASLVYSEDLRLVYKINLSTTSPSGHFDFIIDALNGNVQNVSDATLPRMKTNSPFFRKRNKAIFNSLSGALESFNSLEFAKKTNRILKEEIFSTNGEAQIFDPNPVVTLGRTDLESTTADSVFLPAYKSETLNDISMIDGIYNLRGPKVTLIDFESPKVAPSTSSDGKWNFKRKDPQFNDAMTYFHIDRSIRYIESLGFVNKHAIFSKSIEVDANGVNGDDNSHYIPSSKRLAFGSGCVADNEDSDVVLHELGHAIQDHINPSWRGGDTGAMGEGFGDYWAGSYSVTTEHGHEGNFNWVFKWDGHNKCWDGRKLDALSIKYDSKKVYGAHQKINGGISDEVWSAPIFQAFLELYDRGVARGDIDKIILEAHFGLGANLKMPDMARSIVKTAKALFPNEDYDQVYLKHFKNQKIL
jgi:hypothetical protein